MHTSRHLSPRRRSAGYASVFAALLIAALGFSAVGAAAPGDPTDLKITKTAGAASVAAGSPLSYTIMVENLGPEAATGVTITDPLPQGVDYVSATATQGACDLQGRKLTCAIGGLETGALAKVSSATVTLNVIARQSGSLVNTASVAGDQKDPVASNDQATVTTQVLGKGSKPPPPSATITCRGVPATVVGTGGADILVGTGGRDVIAAFGGADTISSFAGRDLVCAGNGNDSIGAGSAADRVFAGAGKDRVLGRGGADVLKGNSGNDVLKGNRGSDRLRGGSGFDICNGGPGLNSTRGCER